MHNQNINLDILQMRTAANKTMAMHACTLMRNYLHGFLLICPIQPEKNAVDRFWTAGKLVQWAMAR
jgi:hypothetical protein